MLQLYRDNADQWRVGPAGPYALDLNVFNHELREMGILGDERKEWLAKLRLIGQAALHEMKQ